MNNLPTFLKRYKITEKMAGLEIVLVASSEETARKKAWEAWFGKAPFGHCESKTFKVEIVCNK